MSINIVGTLTPEAIEVVHHWNTLARKHGLQTVQRVNAKRCSQLRARLRENTHKQVIHVVEKVFESDFLTGANGGGWQATFDFILRPDKFDNVLEGSYANRTPIKVEAKDPVNEAFKNMVRKMEEDA